MREFFRFKGDTIFSGRRFLINREVVNEKEGSCPKSLVSWLAHVTRTLLRGSHDQLEKAREKDGWTLPIVFSQVWMYKPTHLKM